MVLLNERMALTAMGKLETTLTDRRAYSILIFCLHSCYSSTCIVDLSKINATFVVETQLLLL